MVSKVARRLAPRHPRRSQTNNKEGGGNNDNQQDNQDNQDVDHPQTGYPRRGRGRRGGRPGGYFMEQSKINFYLLLFFRSFFVRLL
jgi:hypothetical protein